ncbi:MAG: signal peptidase I, partial [Terriglobia bacterium]
HLTIPCGYMNLKILSGMSPGGATDPPRDELPAFMITPSNSKLETLMTPEYDPSTLEKASQNGARSVVNNLHAWVRDLLVAVGLALVIIVYLYQPVRVEGVSMLPRIEDQERIFVNKFIYRFKPIARGDVIVFSYPLDPQRFFIKRVIGMPGETVQIRDGKVMIDGRELMESYIPRKFQAPENDPPITVGSDHFYVLGDHRNSSNDSRSWGLVPRRNIYGKAVLCYWPLEKLSLIH